MKKMYLKVVSILVIATVILNTVSISYAASSISSQKNELNQKIQETKDNLNEVNSQKEESQDKVNNLSSQIDSYESKINSLKSEIETKTNEVNELQKKLDELEAEREKNQSLLDERLVTLYESGEVSYLDMLLSSTDLTDFISSYYMIETLTAADKELIQNLENDKKEIADTQEKVNNSLGEIEKNKTELESVQQELSKAKNEEQTKVDKLTEQSHYLENDVEEYEKKMKELKEGNCFPVMGCRSCLSPWKDENGNYKFYGRFNQGVVTINLVDVALSSGGDMDKFWKIFDDRLELCYRALMCRHNRLKGTLSDAAPILWQFGALARLKKGEPIDKLLYGGYSTISLGYAGLYECVKYMTGKSHTDPDATPFALDVMKHMNDACNQWKEETNVAFSIYGSPIESTTYKFAKCLQKRFGIVPGITDKSYITNSYHVFVREEIDAFSKLKFESQFQALSSGGAISYVEVPDMKDNIAAVLQVIRFIYDNIMYAELNTKSDYCQECGYDGEIQIITDEEGKLVWECPHCGNRNQDTLNVARRTCGYIGTQFWNQGRTQEIKERVLHL